jgi:N-acetylneuraminic acid mutarotase
MRVNYQRFNLQRCGQAMFAALALCVMPAIAMAADVKLPQLPKGVTSFGAAVSGDDLYLYGGHWGAAHGYAAEDQSNEFLKLSLSNPQGWQQLESGPRVTGLALVAHDGKLYRVGGFQAKNKDGEAQSLWSTADAARFDPQTGHWTQLPDLPSPRSSHDAAVLGDSLYVFGGWSLEGPEKTTWHTTGCVLDLKQPTAGWKVVESVPFERRAFSVTAHEGKIYVIGGMQKDGGPTTAVSVYDPASGKWSDGPKLPADKEFEGFGNAAVSCGGTLLVTTHGGQAYRLSADGKAWESTGQVAHPRFFHRLVPLSTSEVVSVGGAHMATGKVLELDLVPVGKN